MKIIFLIFLSAIQISSFAQIKTQRIEIKDNLGFKENYRVIEPECKIKHGSYKKFYNGSLIEFGQYENNIKSNIWEYYSNGQIELIYDFTKKELIKSTDNELFANVIIANDTIAENIQQKPILLGSSTYTNAYIAYNVEYPLIAIQNDLSGIVYIGIVIDEHGVVIDHYIAKGKHDILNKEALKVVKSLKLDFIPAIYNNMNVKSVIFYPINFKLGTRP